MGVGTSVGYHRIFLQKPSLWFTPFLFFYDFASAIHHHWLLNRGPLVVPSWVTSPATIFSVQNSLFQWKEWFKWIPCFAPNSGVEGKKGKKKEQGKEREESSLPLFLSSFSLHPLSLRRPMDLNINSSLPILDTCVDADNKILNYFGA